MRYNPIKKIVYTDSGQKIKELNCPELVQWNELKPTNDKNRMCSLCQKSIIDTENLTDFELLNLVKQDQNTCFKVGLNQSNVIITMNT
jgi:hypothetical protein